MKQKDSKGNANTMIEKVISNNFKSFGWHIIILTIAFNLLIISFELINYKFLISYYEVVQVFLSLISVLLYVYVGFRFSPTKNILTDILSFVLVGLMGLLLWLYAFNVSHTTSCRLNMYKDVAWWVYEIYYFVFYFIQQLIESIYKADFCEYQAYIILIWNLGPTLLFLLGIEIRRMYDMYLRTGKSIKTTEADA